MGRRAFGAGALAGIVVATAVLVAGAASMGRSFIVKAGSGHGPGWLFGPLAGLGGPNIDYARLNLLVLGALACWIVALVCARDLRLSWVVAAVVAAHLVILFGPPIFSTDVFGYIGYGRLGAVHGLSPYLHGVDAVPSDPINMYYPLVGVHDPYGPLWTLVGYAVAGSSIGFALWVLKSFAVLTGLGCVALVTRTAQALGREPAPAAVLLGLNPIYLAYGVGGAHNDTFAILFMLVGIYCLVRARPKAASAGFVAGTFAKATAAAALPFAILGSPDRRRVLAWTVIFTVLGSLGSFAIFGSGLRGYPPSLRAQADILYPSSTLGQLRLAGAPDLRSAANVLFAAIVVYLLWRAWRGADWIACTAWAMAAFLLTRGFFAPWYLVGLLGPAAVAGGRALAACVVATTTFSALAGLGLLFT
jgi:hypothetical protein